MHIADDGDLPGLAATVVGGLYEVDGGGEALAAALERVRAEVVAAIDAGARIVVLSDRGGDAARAPIPSLLLTAAVHHHLVRARLRTKVGLVVESGDCREVHHLALLLGYGAAAVNPYLALETVEELAEAGRLSGVDRPHAAANLVKALGKGVLKVMSKMGISTVASYTGAQVFEALGPGPAGGGRLLHRHLVPARRGRAGRARRRGGRPAPHRLPGQPGRAARTAGWTSAGSTSGAGRGGAPVQPGDRLPAPARHPVPPVRRLPPLHVRSGRAVPAGGHAARAVRAAPRGPAAGAARGGGAGRGRSSSGSPPAPCRTGRSRPRRTRRWRSR